MFTAAQLASSDQSFAAFKRLLLMRRRPSFCGPDGLPHLSRYKCSLRRISSQGSSFNPRQYLSYAIFRHLILVTVLWQTKGLYTGDCERMELSSSASSMFKNVIPVRKDDLGVQFHGICGETHVMLLRLSWSFLVTCNQSRRLKAFCCLYYPVH